MEVALVVLDGWGFGPTTDPDHRNAVADAATPTFDRVAAAGAYGALTVSGRSVGLPSGQMGNSEVGHLNIGAGRVVYQAYTRINDAIAASNLTSLDVGVPPDRDDAPAEPLDENAAITAAYDHAATSGGVVHLLGLVSDGGVHSDYRHLFALIELAAARDVEAVTHAFTDGRDTDPRSGTGYLRDLEAIVESHGTGKVATVSGRYFAMDRDENWDRTARTYDAIVRREAPHTAPTASEAVAAAYAREVTDEFVEPTLVRGGRAMEDGDAAICVNFRADRARQLTRMLADIRPAAWRELGHVTEPPDVSLTTMTEYDRTFDLPVAFEPTRPTATIGHVLERAGRRQLRIAESEKYAHVTYFLNGGREVTFEGEIRRIVPSPDVPTYDHQPAMSAPAVTDVAIDVIEDVDPEVLVLNYANPDMVGHTGDYDAAVAAVEAVDTQLGRLLEAVQAGGGASLITADHGNAEDMGSAEAPHTAHTSNDVPFIYLTPAGTDGDRVIRDGGRLADIAPTMLALLGIQKPDVMSGQSLLE